jgi:hypothetical protein
LRLQFFTHFTLISREHLIDFVDVDTGLGEQGLEPFSEIAPELRNLRTLRKSDLVYILPLPFLIVRIAALSRASSITSRFVIPALRRSRTKVSAQDQQETRVLKGPHRVS